jgi:hypothetical protein
LNEFSVISRQPTMPTIAHGHWWLRTCFIGLIALASSSAPAQTLDRVDVVQLQNGDVQIVLRLIPQILYMRHAPAESGSALRIYFRTIGGYSSNLGAEQRETLVSPPSRLAPKFRVTYPEIDGALQVLFDKPVTFQVRQGDDGRSLNIVLPPASVSPSSPTDGSAAPVR